MPVALFLLVTSIQPAVIRGSLAALFFLTDVYAFILSFFAGIVDMTTIYRTLPLILILPIGVFIGNKFFTKSKEELYKKVYHLDPTEDGEAGEEPHGAADEAELGLQGHLHIALYLVECRRVHVDLDQLKVLFYSSSWKTS